MYQYTANDHGQNVQHYMINKGTQIVIFRATRYKLVNTLFLPPPLCTHVPMLQPPTQRTPILALRTSSTLWTHTTCGLAVYQCCTHVTLVIWTPHNRFLHTPGSTPTTPVIHPHNTSATATQYTPTWSFVALRPQDSTTSDPVLYMFSRCYTLLQYPDLNPTQSFTTPVYFLDSTPRHTVQLLRPAHTSGVHQHILITTPWVLHPCTCTRTHPHMQFWSKSCLNATPHTIHTGYTGSFLPFSPTPYTQIICTPIH